MLLFGQRDLWNVAPEDMQPLFISKCWVTIGQLQIVSRRRGKMFPLIQLPTLGNEKVVYALLYFGSEYEICQNKDTKKELWGECFSLYKPTLWLERKTATDATQSEAIGCVM